MKIVYVGDNRNRGNYGCRATSTALSQIISKENEIVGRVYGDYTNTNTGNLFFSKAYPKWIYNKIGKSSHLELIKEHFYTLHRMISHGHYFLGKYDFISYDFDKSINNLIKCLPANPNLKSYDLRNYDFDALVVNGEGSFIFSTPPWRECLIEAMLMYWAEKLGKKVYYLNGMLSSDPYSKLNDKTIEIVKPIFDKAEVIGVREKYSFEFAKKYFPDSNIVMYPDALFSWYRYINDDFKVKDGKYVIGMSNAKDDSYYNFDFTKKYICIGGSSSVGLAAKNKKQIISVYSNLVEKVKNEFKEYNVFIIETCEGDSFLRDVSNNTNVPFIPIDTPILSAGKILANASLFISGRYHPSILASLGGTPCIFMSSNSHKTKSVQEILNYDKIKEFNVLPNDEEIKSIISLSKEKINGGLELRNKIKERCKYLSEETIKQKDLIK